jgi:hypothetical protein
MLARFMAIPHHTYLIMKMSTLNGILSVYGDLIISFKCEDETVDLVATSVCTATTTVMVAQLPRSTPLP